MRNVDAILADVPRAKAEFSLYEYVKQAWHVLHPSTPFTEGWAVGAIAEHLQAVTDGQISRLLINVPPGTSKSMLTNVFWPSWEWGPFGMPEVQYINASYNSELAIRDMMYCRDLISSEWYQERWPLGWKHDDKGKKKFSNDKRGFRYATSVGGGLTGWRGQRFIIDDPHSVQEAESDAERTNAGYWFTETTPTRFTDPKKAVYVIIMQRLHMEDISGIVIDKLLEEQNWTHLCLPMEFEPRYRSYSVVKPRHHKAAPVRVKRVRAEGEPLAHYVEDPEGVLMYPQDPRTEENELLWPERFDEQAVRDLKLQLMIKDGEYAVAGQLQQRPMPREGGMFRVEGAKYVTDAPAGTTIRGWDLAATATKKKSSGIAWTVGVKMTLADDGAIIINDVVRLRGESDEVRRVIRATAERDGYDVAISIPQDPGQAGKAQVNQFVKDLHGFDVSFSAESGAKEARAEPFSAQWNAGNVYMERAPWNDTLVAELTLFPGSTFKDQVDACSRAYAEHLKNVSDPVSLFGARLIT